MTFGRDSEQVKYKDLTSEQQQKLVPLAGYVEPDDVFVVLSNNNIQTTGVVTPRLSTRFCKMQHPYQRKLDRKNLMSIEATFKAPGGFPFLWDPVAFDDGSTGKVCGVNAHHRCFVSARTNISFPALMVFNMSAEQVSALDGGSKRNIAAQMRMGGLGSREGMEGDNDPLLNGVARLCTGRNTLSVQDGKMVLERYAEAFSALGGLVQHALTQMPASAWCPIHYAWLVAPNEVQDFARRVANNEDLKVGTPAHSFRLFLDKVPGNKGGGQSKLITTTTLRALMLHILGDDAPRIPMVPRKLSIVTKAGKNRGKTRQQYPPFKDDEAVMWFARMYLNEEPPGTAIRR